VNSCSSLSTYKQSTIHIGIHCWDALVCFLEISLGLNMERVWNPDWFRIQFWSFSCKYSHMILSLYSTSTIVLV
jgi:hypothetical protein